MPKDYKVDRKTLMDVVAGMPGGYEARTTEIGPSKFCFVILPEETNSEEWKKLMDFLATVAYERCPQDVEGEVAIEIPFRSSEDGKGMVLSVPFPLSADEFNEAREDLIALAQPGALEHAVEEEMAEQVEFSPPIGDA